MPCALREVKTSLKAPNGGQQECEEMAVTGEKGSNEAPEEMLSKGAEEAIGFWHLGLDRTVNVGVEWDDSPGKVPIIAIDGWYPDECHC